MKKNIFIKALAFILIFAFVLAFSACGSVDYSNPTKISFKNALKYEYLKGLDGTPITINGYMATSSPVDGSYIYLMNLPYQSCPFCLPNTNELSNTMAVYPQKGKKFDYTTQAIKITGILEVSRDKSTFFTDNYGYEFNFKIVDAYYEILDESDPCAMWTKTSFPRNNPGTSAHTGRCALFLAFLPDCAIMLASNLRRHISCFF